MSKKNKEKPIKKNNITVYCKKLKGISENISALQSEAFEISDSLQESLGNAADAEKKFIELLELLCTGVFSDMITNTCNLLNAITTDFESTDRKYSQRSNK